MVNLHCSISSSWSTACVAYSITMSGNGQQSCQSHKLFFASHHELAGRSDADFENKGLKFYRPRLPRRWFLQASTPRHGGTRSWQRS